MLDPYHIVNKNELKMDQKRNPKIWNCKTLEENIGQKLCDIGLCNNLLNMMIPKEFGMMKRAGDG